MSRENATLPPYGDGGYSEKEREDLLKGLQASYKEAVLRVERAYWAHYLTCEDPVGCEVRAWQEFYAAERAAREAKSPAKG